MLNIKTVSKHFEAVKALNEISLEINKGEFFGLLGPNGAGKSTLMNIIVGYLMADSGEVRLNNKIVAFEDLGMRNIIGYVPQEISIYLELTAMQNLKIFGGLFNLPKDILKKRIDSVLELVQLNDRKSEPVKNFSGGMKRRLNIAASLLHDPEIILCDEPTAGVDPQSRNAIFEMLQKLNSEGKTIIYTTHYMEEAERLCSRLAIIDNGKIIALGRLPELINLLNKKTTFKIEKNVNTSGFLSQLKEIGDVIENDFSFELVPAGRYDSNSKVFARLEEMGINNDFVEVTRASLEDVFLSLTGRSLRD
ncbi:MAG: ABC transporter ATP-binding protein [Flavobacterium sp.]|nr:ABC transporter ATP-binding protein [Flavobacterium sp.]